MKKRLRDNFTNFPWNLTPKVFVINGGLMKVCSAILGGKVGKGSNFGGGEGLGRPGMIAAVDVGGAGVVVVVVTGT